ncbi:diguanylate cyclase [Agathobacter sp.]
MSEKYSKNTAYKVIAVVIGGLYSVETQQYMKTISDSCKEYNYRWIFFATKTDLFYGNKNDQLEQQIFDLINVSKFDAIVILTETFKSARLFDDLIQRSIKAGTPVFAVDRDMKDCISVMFDYKAAFKQVVRHMVEDHGYRDVCFMNGRRNDVYSEERLDAFKEVLAENDIPFDSKRVYYGDFWEVPTISEMQRMEREWGKMPQAIICANDSMAIAVNGYLREKGYQVPRDVATSGFDGMQISQYCTPRLTTCFHDISNLITRVCECLSDMSQVPADAKYTSSHPMTIGESCGCHGSKPIDIGNEMVNMKSDLYREIEFENSMNEMIPVLTYDASFEDAMKNIFERIHPIKYKNMWICSNIADPSQHTAYSFKQSSWERMGNPSKNIYSDYLWTISDDQAAGTFNLDASQIVSRDDLIPDINSILDTSNTILITSMHLSDHTTGYMAVTFDIKDFWVSAYSTFLTSFCYIIELHKTQARLMQAYMFDPLTGLYNRAGFFDQINKTLAQYTKGNMSLISMDLDGLKYINDTYGHAMGDEAIAALGHIIGENSNRCLSTRIGGDEFLIAIFHDNAADIASHIVKQIRLQVEKYNRTEQKCYTLEVSIGTYTDDIDGKTLDIFMKKADDLMYQNKSQHKNRRRD